MVERYFRIVSHAIKKYDPNHLVLGSRFHGKALRLPEVLQGAGPYVDVVSINLYHVWTPDLGQNRSMGATVRSAGYDYGVVCQGHGFRSG